MGTDFGKLYLFESGELKHEFTAASSTATVVIGDNKLVGLGFGGGFTENNNDLSFAIP